MTIKSCSTCEHRKGFSEFALCLLSGHFCSVERRHPTRCGEDFNGWQKRLSIFERLKFILVGL